MVPPNASPARGHACFEIQPNNTIRYNVWAQKLAGPGTLSLTTSLGTSTLAGGPSSWSGFLPTTTGADLVALQNGTWYFTIITTPAYPGGEIRGRIVAGRRPIPFGSAGPGSLGRRAEIGSDTLPCLGDSIGFQLYGAAPYVPALLVIGGGASPFDLGAVGLSGNVLQVDLSQWYTTLWFPTDGNGCTGCRLPMVRDLSTLGKHLYAQWVILDPGAPGGAVVSNAMDATIQ
jgi:hypothetical protein